VIIGDLLSRLVTRLDAAGIPHMVAGSFASTFHGMPRTTHDIDLVIDPTRTSLETFVRSLPEAEYYVDLQTARDALHDFLPKSPARACFSPQRKTPSLRSSNGAFSPADPSARSETFREFFK
jgi:hypothetical protein